MIKIGIIVGSTRPGRKAEAVAKWVHDIAAKRADAEYEIVDLATFALPLLDEPTPPSRGKSYTKDHTKAWSAKIDGLDGFVFVTPEYNHSTSGALKNALDFVYLEWNNKACGFVGYGAANGVRAIEHLRGIASELQLAHVRAQVGLSLMTDFEGFTTFKPAPYQEKAVGTMLDQLVSWTKAMKTVRA